MNVQTAGTQREDLHQYVTFTLGNVDYGIEILSVQEFKGYSAVTPIPNMPPYVRGVMNLRGIIIPVFDLRVRFGLPAPLDELSVIVVAVVEGRTVGLVVDTVSDVIDIKQSDIQETPEFSSRVPTAFLRGLAKTGDQLVILLNLEHLVSLDDFPAPVAN
ncbi:MAG TPA: chemotaxis protein CheW [Polyangiales bacterium]|nr:chemotaxis protein CheW [Polyangiales bacterium]